MTIDLHGMQVNEAISAILSALLSFDFSYDYQLVIITGKGTGALMNAALDLLDKEQRMYQIDEGKIIVFKEDNEETNFDFDEAMKEIKEK